MTSWASVHKTKEAISKKNNKQSNHIQSYRTKKPQKAKRQKWNTKREELS